MEISRQLSWSSLVCHYGLPATPAWGRWLISQLQQQKRIQQLPGFGFSGVAIKTKRKELQALLRRGLRNHQLPNATKRENRMAARGGLLPNATKRWRGKFVSD